MKTNRKANQVIVLLALLLLLGLVSSMTGCGKKPAEENGGTSAKAESAAKELSYVQISGEEALARMQAETDYLILDVRTPEEFAQGHIPDAVNVAVETIGDTAPPELPDKDQTIFVYCRSGNRSKQASEKLVALGYSNVVEFGGIKDWPGEVVN